MIHVCCDNCRVRFNAPTSLHLTACPECQVMLTSPVALDGLVGYRLFDPLDMVEDLPEALAVQLSTDWDQEQW